MRASGQSNQLADYAGTEPRSRSGYPGLASRCVLVVRAPSLVSAWFAGAPGGVRRPSALVLGKRSVIHSSRSILSLLLQYI